MNKVIKRAVAFLAAVLVLFSALPGVTAKAQDDGVLHTDLQVTGKADNQKVTYTLKLDKTTVSDGRVAVFYNRDLLTLKKDTEGIRFTEADVNKEFVSGEDTGIAYAFVNDSAKSVSGKLLSLNFEVKKNLPGQDTVVKTVVYGLNNEDEQLFAETTLEDTITVGKAELKAPDLKTLTQTMVGVNVKWTKDTNADGYVILRSTSKDGKYSEIATVNSGNYWDILVKNNKTYYYKVKSYRGKGSEKEYSKESNVLSIKVSKFFGLFG